LTTQRTSPAGNPGETFSTPKVKEATGCSLILEVAAVKVGPQFPLTASPYEGSFSEDSNNQRKGIVCLVLPG